MQVKAIAKGIRISPRKVAVVAGLVRRRSVADALVILSHTERSAAQPITKLINSAVANARHNLKLSPEDIKKLEIQTIMVTEAPSTRRYKFVGTGRRARPRPMLKRSSHITVILALPQAKEATNPSKDAKSAKPASTPKKAEAKTPIKSTKAKPAAKKTPAKSATKPVKEAKK